MDKDNLIFNINMEEKSLKSKAKFLYPNHVYQKIRKCPKYFYY